MSLLIHACTKDEEVFDREKRDTTIQLRDARDHIYTPSDTVKETILGNKASCNPYTVDIVTQAWNNLYPSQSVASLPASHRYVKFKPDTPEEVYNLYKDSALVVWDYPLDYEVIQMGDFYTQPGKGENDLPDLYSVVDIDYNFEVGVAYEELEQLVKVPYNTILSAESYRLCNLKHIVVYPSDDPPSNDNPSIIEFEDCKPGCPNFPCCFLKNVDCDGAISPEIQLLCDEMNWPCLPDDPDWPECLYPDDGDDDVLLNDCGCPRYDDERKPAGCVEVQQPTEVSVL